MKKFYTYNCLIITIVFASNPIFAINTISLKKTDKSIPVGSYLEIFEDKSKKLVVHDIITNEYDKQFKKKR